MSRARVDLARERGGEPCHLREVEHAHLRRLGRLGDLDLIEAVPQGAAQRGNSALDQSTARRQRILITTAASWSECGGGKAKASSSSHMYSW